MRIAYAVNCFDVDPMSITVAGVFGVRSVSDASP